MTSVQEQLDAQSPWLTRGKYAVYVVAWVTFVALDFVLVMFLMSPIIKILMELFEVNRWARSAVHNFSFVILGLVGLSMVIVVENYLRAAVSQNLLLRRTAIALGSVLILVAASLAFHQFLIFLLTR